MPRFPLISRNPWKQFTNLLQSIGDIDSFATTCLSNFEIWLIAVYFTQMIYN